MLPVPVLELVSVLPVKKADGWSLKPNDRWGLNIWLGRSVALYRNTLGRSVGTAPDLSGIKVGIREFGWEKKGSGYVMDVRGSSVIRMRQMEVTSSCPIVV